MAAGYMDVESDQQQQTSKGLMAEIRATRVYTIWLVITVYILSIAIFLPAKPQTYTNFFASQRAGYSVQCQQFGKGREPSFCQDAHSDAVWWGSFTDFVSHSIVAFLLVPIVGRWSDIHGRRPFVGLFLLVACIPPVLMAAHINLGVTLYFYFFAEALAGYSALMLMCTAYVTDLISPRNRAPALSLNMAGFGLAFAFGPGIGGLVGTVLASYLSMGGALCTLLLHILFVSESLSTEARQKAQEKQAQEGKWGQAPWHCIKIVSRSKLASRLSICVCLSGFVALGFMEMLSQYLELKLDYSKSDLAVLMTVAGLCAIFAQAVLMRILVACFREAQIIVFSAISRAVEQVVMCFATNKAMVFVGVIFGSFAALLMPASASLLSRHTSPYEQGAVQGAVYGLLALSQGIGPLVFAFLFSGFTRSDSSWTYFPGAPYLFGAVLMAVCGMLALTIEGQIERSTYQEPVLGIPIGKSGELSPVSSQGLTHRPSSALDSQLGHSSTSLESMPSKRLSVEHTRRDPGSVDSNLPLRKSGRL